MSASKTTTTDPVAAERAAQSWVGKFVKDAYERTLGLVMRKELIDGEWTLWARFPGEATERKIYLVPRQDITDIDFLSPGHVKARYRPITEDDQKLINAMKAKRRAKAA